MYDGNTVLTFPCIHVANTTLFSRNKNQNRIIVRSENSSLCHVTDVYAYCRMHIQNVSPDYSLLYLLVGVNKFHLSFSPIHLYTSYCAGLDHDMPMCSVLCPLSRHLVSGHIPFHQVSPPQLWSASISLSI